ncbi:hypothetical protein Patl1_13777 [Pistacia atlantica]|uniref:Uncharacterized protein n=1 Tax=Pistacia atlantica TaxID=434234 RepID=A0ACC1AT93_9ROSI|nr:hypothetical protein Patl1_13777 [Pistacia atlantica]
MGRTPCCSKEGLNKGAWTAIEDQILCDYIKTHGEGKWRRIPKEAALQCGTKGLRSSEALVTHQLYQGKNIKTNNVKAEATAKKDIDNSEDGAVSQENSILQNCAMEFNFEELLLSDISDSDFWKLYDNLDNCTEESGNSSGGGGANEKLYLDESFSFSEELLKDWIRDDSFS